MRAYCTARWPSPPTPKIATVSAGATRATLIALYVVTPAQRQRRRIVGRHRVRHRRGECGRHDRVLGEGAVDRVAGVLLLLAQRLPAGDAVAALAAGVAEPGDRDPLADAPGR